MVIMATFVILLSIAEEQDNKKKPKEWYRNWALSQDNPYVQNRIREMCKYNFCLPILLSRILARRISLGRGARVADSTPRGWFLKFCYDRVRANIILEARQAYLDRVAARSKFHSWK